MRVGDQAGPHGSAFYFQKNPFAILKKYEDVIDLSLIGFPQNYKNII